MQNSFIITIPSSEYLTFNFILTNQLSDDGLPRYLTVKAVGFFFILWKYLHAKPSIFMHQFTQNVI